MEFLPISFLAGILTILAPCILPLLPVIIGGSISSENKSRPLIITLSLAVSIIVFTLLLKATTALINIPQSFWTWFSASIIFIFAITLLFPSAWPKFINWFTKTFRIPASNHKSQKILFKFYKKKGFWSSVVLGAALGPVFASCSPTYFLILGTVLPSSFFIGLVNLIAYALGLALVMFLIAYAGQRFTKTLNLAANPKGWFKRGLGILFLIVALGIASGYDKKFEAYLLDQGLFDITKVEQRILDNMQSKDPNIITNPENPLNQNHTVFNTNVPAPDIIGLENWINTDGYNSLEELRGKVVLIDFWTYSCINCIRTLPYLQDWHEKYTDEGLVILGIHAPEFAFEKIPENVVNAVEEYGLTYPVVQDNDFQTWRNYENRYWPAKYLIDKNGQVRYYHFGEGDYEETEEAITLLLNTEVKDSEVNANDVDHSNIRTRETYLGTARREKFAGFNANELSQNEWSLTGEWQEDGEKIYTSKFPASFSMNFNAADINLVMEGNATGKIYIDDEFHKTITINEPKLYVIFESNEYKERNVRIEFEGESLEAFALTFG